MVNDLGSFSYLLPKDYVTHQIQFCGHKKVTSGSADEQRSSLIRPLEGSISTPMWRGSIATDKEFYYFPLFPLVIVPLLITVFKRFSM